MIKIIFLTVLPWFDLPPSADSLRTETINGKLFVIHQVNAKETLYSISRRYGATITGVLDSNPGADSGLEIGQLLKVPYVPKSKSTTSGGGIHKVQPKETLFSISKLYDISVEDIKAWNYLTDNSISVGQDLRVKKPTSFTDTRQTETRQTETRNANAKGTHTVAAGETLFSISRQYNVTVDQLKSWNSISDTGLKVGQVLTVAARTTSTVAENKTTETRQTQTTASTSGTNTTEKKEQKEQTSTAPVIVEPSVKISESVVGTDEVRENGLAELIEGTEGNRKYLAFHRTATPNTIIKVRNELNNREVFVRVVGTLPDTGVNDKLIVKLSRSAYDRLGAIDPKFKVEVTYYK
jgi:LysM repeat protein